jgi:fluoroquinolone transport system ATP-binding protein
MIDVKNLSYTYPKSNQPALRGLNFAIQPGEVFGFLGPSGSGKSTTQKILIGLLDGFQGTVTVMNRPVTTWDSSYYEKIGVAFEQPNLFLKLTGMENLRYFAALYSHRTLDPRELLHSVGLEEDSDLLVGQYSKGMKGRLTVARAMLNDPDLLFLDEPTSGLDPVNARKIKDLIRAQQTAGKTIFLTTHNMSVADELCDRVAFLVDGQIELVDTPHALKLQYGKRVVRVQYQNSHGNESRDYALENIGSNQDFFETLRDHAIETIHTQEATLEDIFIQVTGRSLL